MKLALVFAIVFLTAGCNGYAQQVQELGSELIERRNQNSAAAISLSREYICRGAPIGAVLDNFNTDDLREAWRTICGRPTELP